MLTREIEVKIEGGLEARPTAMLVQLACSFDSQIYLEYAGKNVNVKSIMGMLSLGICEGTTLKLSADGNDEEQAISEIEKYFSGQE